MKQYNTLLFSSDFFFKKVNTRLFISASCCNQQNLKLQVSNGMEPEVGAKEKQKESLL